jgi:hypothetical protein
MSMNFKLPLFSFLLLFIFLSSGVFASTNTTYNQEFTSNASGIVLASYQYCASLGWSNSCYGNTGCVNISIYNPSDTCYLAIFTASEWQNSYQTAFEYFSNNWFSYEINNNRFLEYELSGNNTGLFSFTYIYKTILQEQISSSAGITNGKVIYIPNVSYDRKLIAQIEVWMDTGPYHRNFYMDFFNYTEISTPIVTSCTPTISKTTCDQQNFSRYVTTDGCDFTYKSCPIGTTCEQLTPQVNVAPPLIENYTSCDTKTIFGYYVKCSAICYKDFYGTWHSLDTNCPIGCREYVCEGQTTGIWPNWIVPPQVYTTNNPNSITIPSWTIACINSTDGMTNNIVVDNIGNNTTEGELILTHNPDFTCPNTTYNCFNANCNPVVCYKIPSNNTTINNPTNITSTSYGFQFNAYFNIPNLSLIVAFITSLIVSMIVFFSIKQKSIESFIIPFMAILAFFSLPNIEFFPSWFLILQATGIGLLIFFKARG